MINETEIKRLRILEEYHVLDTLPEEIFDDITSLASTICDMPISLISLIDEGRQFFKSHHGVEINETPIELSICKHAIESNDEVFEIVDLREDFRFKNNPLVTVDPKIISYFGIPLKSAKGIAFGTLCVISKEKKVLNQQQKDTLKVLSKQVINLLELRKSNFLLQTSQKKLEEYIHETREFTYIAAHDLKAPVRGINSFLKLIENKHTDIWDDKDRKYLNVIFDNVSRMDNLILDLMNYANCTSIEISNENINVDTLVKDIFENLIKNLNIPEAKLTTSELPNMMYSSNAISLIFKNLINNALKYQTSESIPEIEINCIENKVDWIFEVKDNGIGIAEEHFETIFKPFKRLHLQSEFAGSGLGLAATKKLIQNLNGDIWVKSKEGEGTNFIFRLPK
jgi:K+-sensing histidine kinase KdpD